jgi:DNA-binding transcriptional regulator YhcF (GntR family)
MIDPTAPDWPRQQAARIIRERIASDELGPKLPSQMKLADQIGVSPKTMEKVIAMLKDEGLLIADLDGWQSHGVHETMARQGAHTWPREQASG